jgi:hypothetical protein
MTPLGGVPPYPGDKRQWGKLRLIGFILLIWSFVNRVMDMEVRQPASEIRVAFTGSGWRSDR